VAYQETTPTSLAQLISQVSTFAQGLGWTETENTLSGSVRNLTLKRSETDYIYLYNRSDVDSGTTLLLRSSTSFTSGVAPDSQTGGLSPYRAQSQLFTPPYTKMYLFGDNLPAPYVFGVIEYTGGFYRHFGFGLLSKYGSYTGGTFYDAEHWNRTTSVTPSQDFISVPQSPNHHVLFRGYINWTTDTDPPVNGAVRCDADGRTNAYAAFRSGNSSTFAAGSGLPDKPNVADGFFARTANPFSGNTALLPINIFVQRPNPYYSPIGYVPGIRFLNMQNFVAAQEFNVGTDTYKVFPWVRKGYAQGVESSLNYAFAYLKTP
jgi:hypothetical protein